MENDKTVNENNNEQPKPNDDVQMEIETVVPSAHQAEITPGNAETPDEVNEDQPADETSEEEGKPVTEGEEGAEQPAAVTEESKSDVQPSTEETTPKEDEETNDTENTDDVGKKDSGDERDEIETVAP